MLQKRNRIYVFLAISITLICGSDSNADCLKWLKRFGAIHFDFTSETKVIHSIAQLNQSGKLRPLIKDAVKEARNEIPAVNKIGATDDELTALIHSYLDAELMSRGLGPKGNEMRFPSWQEVSTRQLDLLKQSGSARLSDSAFLSELEWITNSAFTTGNSIQILNSSGQANNSRIALIKKAVWRIDIATWGWEDDVSGTYYADQLIEKNSNGVNVTIVTDFLTAQRPKMRENLKRMETAGIRVIYSRLPENPYYGQHRKAIVVDGFLATGAAIIGGRNFGDAYLHMGPAGSRAWRDVDLEIAGPAVTELQSLIDRMIDSASSRHPSVTHTSPKQRPVINMNPAQTLAAIAIVDHVPSINSDARIYLGLLKAISAAETSVDIANAYVIATPAMKQVIAGAIQRGVKVRILSNSVESVDEPIVSVPIQLSLAEYLKMGCEIYVKRGQTLHSKTMLVDGKLGVIMSHNDHPRSVRYETELAAFVTGSVRLADLLTGYEQDLIEAKRVLKVADLNIPDDPQLALLAMKYFFDQL